jgi:putative membrane protein insertion efficiency factor
MTAAWKRLWHVVAAGVSAVGAAVVTGLVFLLRIYQVHVSPALPPTCRFYPSCSQYAVEALQVHGVVRGVGLTTWRLLRCHPWHPGGADPVPPRRGDRPSPVAARPGAAEDHHEEQAPC